MSTFNVNNMANVLKTYNDVINDVISGIRDVFAEEGVDEQVLYDLKQNWTSKLYSSKAVSTDVNKTKADLPSRAEEASTHPKQMVGEVPPNNHMQTSSLNNPNRIQVKVTLPSNNNESQSSFLLHVPDSIVRDNLLPHILTGQVITSSLCLPSSLISSYLQEQVDIFYQRHMQSRGNASNLQQKIRNYPPYQCDGPCDSSDDDSSENGSVSDNNDPNKDTEITDGAGENPEERSDDDPLNSGDDLTDENEEAEMFDCDNIIVCQFDKVTRNRNKWKFNMKDGIMHLNGLDYVFQKLTGEAEW